ncbi:hypothetical protein DV738_g75, partial [Chaetothyriales sp. CBS 135597]
MDVIFNNRQRPILQLPQVIEALERLRDDPQQLARERDRLYTEPPPPYSEDSGETTEPEPNEPPTATVDKTYQRRLRREAHWKSTPINQFESQAQRERERLLHQISARTSGRRQTLPWDNSLDLKANPENNVRSRWVEQGIWGDNWGPAWPKNSQPLTTKWLHEGGGPFQGDYNPATSESRPGARYIQTHWGPVPRYPIPIPTVRNPEASRPYHQFVYQISKEREWIQDEMAHTAPGSVFDLDAMAYESVKNNWIKDGSPTPADGGPAEASRGTEAVLPSLSRNNVRSRPGRSKRSRESDTTTEQAPKRQLATRTPSGKRPGVRQNQSILNFFGKADKNDPVGANAQPAALFFDEKATPRSQPEQPEQPQQQLDRECLSDVVSPEEGSRFNEDDKPVKRRRTSNSTDDLIVRTPSPGLENISETVVEVDNATKPPAARNSKRIAGFVDDSDDEDAPDLGWASSRLEEASSGCDNDNVEAQTGSSLVLLDLPDDAIQHATLRRKEDVGSSASISLGFRPKDSTDQDDFENDDFYAGEEFLARQFMLEQQEMELAFEEEARSETDKVNRVEVADESLASCPICGGSLECLSEAQASSHVNACLDGTAPSLPPGSEPTARPPQKQEAHTPPPSRSAAPPNHRFQRAATARPAQASPFSLSNNDKSSGSAFARLMSGHAEFAAWAEAAANEASSRGKMAYQRTCPFYKIMPGLSICVDAFRYGKVEGQSAYFLSHFHSDHYIGLTSSWCHGPIYASKVTCNLMKQQLRVDAAWIVPLEFEQKTEVPNTNGVFVTMIPANHCPGSSLFLFEKEIGKNRDGSPKLTRVLHCGDFRACRAHVTHPLLRPDVVDSITGATRQQVIDTCYLDTTYLTPKYAFPSQQDVISACAQMCVSLAKEIADPTDAWETTVAATTGAGNVMTRFLESGSAKAEANEKSDTTNTKTKSRGRLLVVIGTYSIGKERICLGIARALGSKIYAPPGKMRICRALGDDELNKLLTPHPLEAQVHMQTLMEIRAETLHDYLTTLKPAFSRVVGFRPTGWNYRPPPANGNSGRIDNPSVTAVLHSEGWKSRFTPKDLAAAVQRGSTTEAQCFGVPYSEHSSFRELTMFVCALRINRVIPTVNVGSAASRDKMKAWIEKWEMEKRKNGLTR